MQNIKIWSGRISSHALCSEPLGPFLDLKMISLQKQQEQNLRKKGSHFQVEHEGTEYKDMSIIEENKPRQALPVIYSWAASADCKLHAPIILILCTLAHHTFMHRTSEFLSGSSNFNLKMCGLFTIWV
jgi:hypothetical protein